MDSLSFKSEVNSKEMQFTIMPRGAPPEEEEVCANYPRLRKMYDRAKDAGLSTVADRIARVCETLEER